jgi:hypothetical protein
VQQVGVVIKTLYDDLERIEQALPAYGAGLVLKQAIADAV